MNGVGSRAAATALLAAIALAAAACGSGGSASSGGGSGPIAIGVPVPLSGDYASAGTLGVKDGIALTFQPDILDAIARGKGPRRALFAVGYAGWAPGQIEAEMKTGAWARASADEALIFDGDHDTKWDRAMARRKIDL